MLRNSQHLSSESSHIMSLQALLKYMLIASLLSSATVVLLAGVGAWLGLERLIDWTIKYSNCFTFIRNLACLCFPIPHSSRQWVHLKYQHSPQQGLHLYFSFQRHPKMTIYYMICASFGMMWILNTFLKEILEEADRAGSPSHCARI